MPRKGYETYKGHDRKYYAEKFCKALSSFHCLCRKYGLDEVVKNKGYPPKGWRKGDLAIEGAGYTCKVGDRVISDGKEYSVATIICAGSKTHRLHSDISCNPIDPYTGKVLTRTNVCLGSSWRNK